MSDENNELQIRIRAIADLKAGEQANQMLQQTTQAAESAAAATARLNAESAKTAAPKPAGFTKAGGLPIDQFQARAAAAAAAPSPSGFAAVTAKVKEMKHEFSEAGGGIKGFMSVLFGSGASVAAWAAGIVGAAGLATKALSVFMQKQVEVAKLDAVLANQGKLTDDYREKLQALAGQFAKLTATSSNEWLQAETTLNKFGADTSNIESYMEAVKNLAGFMEGGIPEAAFLFGKAMTGNHAMLARYGITVDSAASKTEQLSSIMEQAAERGGGVLESRAKTLSGQFDAFHGAVKKLLGGLGLMIAQTGVVQYVLHGLTESLLWLGKVFPKLVPQVDGLRNSFARASRTMEEQEAAAKRLADYTTALGKSAEIAAEQHNQLRESINRVAQARAELLDANQALGLANIDNDVKLFEATGGKRGISPAEGARRKAVLQNETEEAKFKAEQEARNREVNADEGRLKQLRDAVAAAHNNTVLNQRAKDNFEREVVPKQRASQQAGRDVIAAIKELQAAEADLATGATGPTDLDNKRKAVTDAKANVERLRVRKDKTKAAREAAEQTHREHYGDFNVGAAQAEEKTAREALEKGETELKPRITAGREVIASKEAARSLKRPADQITNFADIIAKQRAEIERLREAGTNEGRTAAGAAPLTFKQFSGSTNLTNAAATKLNQLEALSARLTELSQASKTDPAKAAELKKVLAVMERLQAEISGYLANAGRIVTPPALNPVLPPEVAPPAPRAPEPPPVLSPEQKSEAEYKRRERELLDKIARFQANAEQPHASATQIEANTRNKAKLERKLAELRDAHTTASAPAPVVVAPPASPAPAQAVAPLPGPAPAAAAPAHPNAPTTVPSPAPTVAPSVERPEAPNPGGQRPEAGGSESRPTAPPAAAQPQPVREVQQAVSASSKQVGSELRELSRAITDGFGDLRQAIASVRKDVDSSNRQMRDLDSRFNSHRT